MSKLTKNMDIIMSQGQSLLAFYRENPCIAAYDLLGVDLAPIQRVVFEDMWFKPYTLAIAGRGFGKCQSLKSITQIKGSGLIYLHEFLPEIPKHLNDGEEEVIDWTSSIYTSEGFRNIKKLALEKGVVGKKLVTQNKYENEGSNHHPLLTITSTGDLVYKRLDEFKVGDRVCIQRGQNVFGNNDITTDASYLIGLLIGDGSIGNKSALTITSEDLEILNFCENFYKNENINFNNTPDKRTKATHVLRFSNKLNSFLEKHEVDRVLSYDKSVPYSIRTTTRESQIAFLQGYFDTDGTAHNKNGGVSCCSVSKKLLKEVQLMLLNFGIISRVRKKKTKSKFGKAYLLDIFSEDAFKFKELIGFRLKRKQKILDKYFSNKKLNTNKDTIPEVLTLCHEITKYYHNKYKTSKKPSFRIRTGNKKEVTYERLHRFIIQCHDIEKAGFSLFAVKKDIDNLKELLKCNYYYDTVVSIEDWKGDCYDFEMDMLDATIEPNYFSNGFINHNTFLSGVLASLLCLLYPGYRVGLIAPSFRQSKMIFSEVEKLYVQSSILREATQKRPIRGSDTCYLEFRSVAGHTAARIEALPIGADGAKIRGSRFYCILVDEFAQVPQKIIETVLAPMSITKLDPMKKVRELERRNKLIAAGLAIDSDFEEDTVNKMIGTSSGYYKFNHMYKRMREYWNQIYEGSKDHAVYQIPYNLLPDGFLDRKNVENARRVMSDHEFRMEYMADMVSDSEGFFKASILEDCTIGSGFKVELVGEAYSKYIIGIDPNQGGSAKCGVVVVKLGGDFNKVVRVLALDGNTTQDITMAVQGLCKNYNVVRIYMDKGGGGKAVLDLLEEGYNEEELILERDNSDNVRKEGKHILEAISFGTAWISEANYATLSLLEDKKMRFPEATLAKSSAKDLEDREQVKITELKKQCVSIVVTQTSSGALHFDTPKKGQNKDLYSAFILACYGVKALGREVEEEEGNELYNSGGMVRGRGIGNWHATTSQGGNTRLIVGNVGLKRRIK